MGTTVPYSPPMRNWLAVMRVVGRDKLQKFCTAHHEARKWIANWLAEVGEATWESPQTIKARFPAASFLADNTVIFNVKGNAFRLEVAVGYTAGVVQVIWIGTHAQYDRRNARR